MLSPLKPSDQEKRYWSNTEVETTCSYSKDTALCNNTTSTIACTPTSVQQTITSTMTQSKDQPPSNANSKGIHSTSTLSPHSRSTIIASFTVRITRSARFCGVCLRIKSLRGIFCTRCWRGWGSFHRNCTISAIWMGSNSWACGKRNAEQFSKPTCR